MKRCCRRLGLPFALLMAWALLISGCANVGVGNQDIPARRVLFVGNSFTHYNGGIDRDLQGLAPRTSVASVAPGGYRLSSHLADQSTLAKLNEGWNYVILQEQSQLPVIGFSEYLKSAKSLSAKIRATKATPMLLMTWKRPDTPRVTTEALRRAVSDAAKQIGITAIPAGVAFAKSLASRPEIGLYQHDGHPTREGTYLAACTVYASAFGVSPVGNGYTAGLEPDVVLALQTAAAKAAGR